jgi:hypothetical protein
MQFDKVDKHYARGSVMSLCLKTNAAIAIILLTASFSGCFLRTTPEKAHTVGSLTGVNKFDSVGCLPDARAEDLERAKKTLRRFVAGSCLVMTLMGSVSAQAITHQESNAYLKQFSTTCTTWNEGDAVTLLAAPSISDELPDKVACKSPSHKRIFEDAGRDTPLVRLFAARIFFATLTGAGQFLPDDGTAIPSKYLHRYLTGIGGKKIISEPALVNGLENIIRKKWISLRASSEQPLGSASFVVSYADYGPESTGVAAETGRKLPNDGIASDFHPLHNALGSAEVRVTYYKSLDEIHENRTGATVIENLHLMKSSLGSSSGSKPAGYLVAEINDPYSWPGSSKSSSGDPARGYDQWRDGTAEGIKATEQHETGVYYTGNGMPELLVRLVRVLLAEQGNSNQFTEARVITAANYPRELIELGLIPEDFRQEDFGLNDNLFRAMLRAGTKDFMMVKHWIIPIF